MLPLHIYTEGDQQRGLGHLTRCSAYATTWEQAGGTTIWHVDGDELAKRLLNQQTVIWKKWQTINTAPPKQDAIALIDSYSAPLLLYQHVSRQYQKAAFLDDTYRLPYPSGLAIHAAPGEKKDMQGDATWVYGPQWQPLRSAFWNIPGRNNIEAEVKNILIILGGTDHRNLTCSILRVARAHYPYAHIHVVTTSEISLGKNCTQHSLISAEDIAKLMILCDIAISAAGQTIYELAACGTPSILICTAENQKLQIEGWKSLGCLHYAGQWSDSHLFPNISALLEKMKKISVRESDSRKLQNTVDGSGTKRLLEWANT